MFLHRVGSSDPRFHGLSFHDGLNLVISEKAAQSGLGDSRNGTGKSSLVRILRFLLGGNADAGLRMPELASHGFTCRVSLPQSADGDPALVDVERFIASPSKVFTTPVGGEDRRERQIEEWRETLGAQLFALTGEAPRPTAASLMAQLIRTYFGGDGKTYGAESDWEQGVRLGYFLGLSPATLVKTGEVRRLESQRKALRGAIKEGALAHLSLNVGELRSQLAEARTRRDRAAESLKAFKVDAQYRDHQVEADRLSAEISSLNDRVLARKRRLGDLERSLAGEAGPVAREAFEARVARAYSELGVVLPDAVRRRFEEVREFGDSLLRNRRHFLSSEVDQMKAEITGLSDERRQLDLGRAEILRLLAESVALDTFLEAERSLAQLQGLVADLERRLDAAQSIGRIGTTISIKAAEAKAAVEGELSERSAVSDRAIALFSELGAEIYLDRKARLIVSAGDAGILRVEPDISGDSSDGIRGVATFLLDIVLLVSAVEQGRAPGILVHDSHLFDAVDHRQIGSCLTIGARLALEHGFQYIVTMNSDTLASVEGEGAFDRAEFAVEPTLSDGSDEGGLFGFRFD